jgi:nucleoid-associated protein YgaU
MAGMLPATLVPASAHAKAQLRFVHALPGVGEGDLTVVRGSTAKPVASATFGHITHYVPVAPGSFSLELRPHGSEKAVTTTKAHLNDHGHYTALALAASSMSSQQVRLMVLRDGAAKAGTARLRLVHAAPELGAPNVQLDGKTVAEKFPFGKASAYLTVPPGKHDVAVVKPGASMPLLSLKGLTFKAGTAATAIVVGSRGEKVRAVLASDDVVTPPEKRKVKAKIKTTSGRSGKDVLVVRSGDCLWHIAETLEPRGASAADVQHRMVAIWNRNKKTLRSGDPSLIYPGEKLEL